MTNSGVNIISRIINTLAPAQCVICGGRLTAGEDMVCATCNFHFPRTDFELSPYDNIMAKMFWGRFHIEKCAALFYYHSHSKTSDIILDLKYNKHPEYGFELGRLMANQFVKSGFFDGISGVMPMPLASNRELKRGYNQSREVVKGICSVTGLPMIDKAIKREKFKDSQTHKTRSQRVDNVANAFTLVKPELLSSKHVLLVDDVATTGATISACAKEMEKAGNVKISVATVAFAGH